MSKTVVLISKTLNAKECLQIENESEHLHIIWEQFDGFKHVQDELAKLNEELIDKVIKAYSPDYIAIDLPLKVEKVEQLLYTVEHKNVTLLERLNGKFIQLNIPT
jgi:transcriptional/translational regulatory protein YebC/TACO1